jgi:transcriptional regulator with XRE-family HTH domain
MEFVGQYLKSKRINNKFTIEKLSEELNISQSLIRSIELDDFPEYLGSVYIMGHIRSYANFFDLDADDLIETFKIQISYKKLEIKQISKPIKTVNLFFFTKIFYFASTSIIAFTFYFMFVRPSNIDLEYAMTPDLPENLQYNLEEIEMNISLSQEINKDLKSSLLEIAGQREKFDEGLGHFNSSSVLAFDPKDFSLNDNADKITLRFINPTWIQLRDNNDNIVISKLMNDNDEYSYNISNKLNLTAGNAGNIIVSLNGIVKGKVGKAGDVVESLVIDKNFNN